MSHKLYDLWREYEGSRKVWKVQFAYGVLTFPSKKAALEAVDILRQTDQRYKRAVVAKRFLHTKEVR